MIKSLANRKETSASHPVDRKARTETYKVTSCFHTGSLTDGLVCVMPDNHSFFSSPLGVVAPLRSPGKLNFFPNPAVRLLAAISNARLMLPMLRIPPPTGVGGAEGVYFAAPLAAGSNALSIGSRETNSEFSNWTTT